MNGTLVEVSADTGGSQGAVTPAKGAIKVDKPQEMLQLNPGRRLGPIHQSSHLPGIHVDTPSGDYVPQKGDGAAMELLLLCLNKQLVLKEALKNLSAVEHMFLEGAGEDEDVINVDKDELVQYDAEKGLLGGAVVKDAVLQRQLCHQRLWVHAQALS